MTEPTVNMELVERTLNWIENNLDRWNQRHYVIAKELTSPEGDYRETLCNTTFCFAGTALFIENRLAYSNDGYSLMPVDSNGQINGPSFEPIARELLGLNIYQAWTIFYAMTDDFAKFKEHVLWVVNHPDDLDEMRERKFKMDHSDSGYY